jgi:leader peptidase (prepilin peptidase)/N-methyltransferase
MDPTLALDLANTGWNPEVAAPFALAFQLLAVSWGAAWGSFLNVVVYRLPLGLSLIRPGSRCSTCGTPIKWYDNVPVLGYLVLRGRCRACKTRYGARYALVEALCGLLSLMIFNAVALPLDPDTVRWGLLTWVWLLTFAGALVALALIDLEHFILPDEITLPLIALGVVGGLMLPSVEGLHGVFGAVLGGGAILAIWALGWLIYRREAMGLGDAKLLAVIGAFLGWQALPFVLLAASVQALLAVLGATLYTRVTGRRSLTVSTEELDAHFGEEGRYGEQRSRLALPFGPFLALAALEALFMGVEPFYLWVRVLSAWVSPGTID